jgi:hypothetical protein
MQCSEYAASFEPTPEGGQAVWFGGRPSPLEAAIGLDSLVYCANTVLNRSERVGIIRCS